MSQFYWKSAFTLFAILNVTQAWKLVCFKGSISNYYNVTFENATQQITRGYIDINKPTVICAHGYRGSIETQGTNLLIAVFLLLGINVCAIDYSKEADFGQIPVLNYPASVATSIYVVSSEMAQAIMKLEQLGLNVKTLHMVGHSLGAHVCGNTGAIFKTMTNRTIARITGLDPAKPGFDGTTHPYQRLDKENADFVVHIQTDPDGYGMASTTGHLNFIVCPIEYGNNRVQPGCPPFNPFVYFSLTPEGACSHQRSVRLYVDALTYGCQVMAAKAESLNAWATPGFIPNEVTCIGEDTNQSYRGNFYCWTNTQSPFGLGVKGQTPQ